MFPHSAINHPIYKFINSVVRALRPLLDVLSRQAFKIQKKSNSAEDLYRMYFDFFKEAFETSWQSDVLVPGIKYMLLNRIFMFKKRRMSLDMENGKGNDEIYSKMWLDVIPAQFRDENYTLQAAINFWNENGSEWELRINSSE